MSDLSTMLETQMRRKGWTQAKLAELSGITPAAVSQILSGDRNPGIWTLVKMCAAFGLTPNDLLGFHSDEKTIMLREIAELKQKLADIKRALK